MRVWPAILLPFWSFSIFSSPCFGVRYVVDDFDGGADPRVQSFSFEPSNGSPRFSSPFDVFGPTDRTVNSDFADDSVVGLGNPNEFDLDDLGIAPFATYPAGNSFFGVEDLKNPDHPTGSGTAVWVVDYSGLEDLFLSVDFSAMGNFEPTDNSHTFSVSIDGGPTQTLITIDAQDDLRFRYTMENGSEVVVDDPLFLTDDFGRRAIDNSFTTQGVAAISGTGSTLTITYTAGVNHGPSEPFAFDNLVLTDEVASIPDPDVDDDLDVDGADFIVIGRTNSQWIAGWQQQFGQGVASLSAIPEPSTFVSMLAACGLAGLRLRLRLRTRR